MTPQEQQAVIEQAADTYGRLPQMDMAMEECAELIQAVAKVKRRPGSITFNNLYEEMADVEIMIAQLKYLFACDAEVEKKKQFKLRRLNERLNIRLERAK